MRLHRANQRKVSHSRGSCGPKTASRATISSRRLQKGVAQHEGGRPEYPAYIYGQSGGLPGFIQVDRGAARPRTGSGRHRGLKLSMYCVPLNSGERRNRDSRNGGAACDARRGERCASIGNERAGGRGWGKRPAAKLLLSIYKIFQLDLELKL